MSPATLGLLSCLAAVQQDVPGALGDEPSKRLMDLRALAGHLRGEVESQEAEVLVLKERVEELLRRRGKRDAQAGTTDGRRLSSSAADSINVWNEETLYVFNNTLGTGIHHGGFNRTVRRTVRDNLAQVAPAADAPRKIRASSCAPPRARRWWSAPRVRSGTSIRNWDTRGKRRTTRRLT